MVRIYKDFDEMLRNEIQDKELLEQFVDHMIDENNYEINFYQWFKVYRGFKTLGSSIYLTHCYNFEKLKKKLEKYDIDEMEDDELIQKIKEELEMEE